MAKNQKVQFKSLPKLRRRQGKEDLTIVGGMIAEKEVLAWLGKWSLSEMPWQLWETTDELQLKHDSALSSLTNVELMMLERLRLFGEGGDLTVRRDDEQFRWYFIGPKGVSVPPRAQEPEDFWKDNPKKKLTRFKGQVILWGVWDSESDKKRWVENRVGFANLAYPERLHGERHVYAHYWEFLDAGQVAFVWMYKLGAGEDDPLLGQPLPPTQEPIISEGSLPSSQPSNPAGHAVAEGQGDDGSKEAEIEEARPDEQPEEAEIEEARPDHGPQEAEIEELLPDDTSQVSQKDDPAPKPRTITEILQGFLGFGRR